MPFFSLLSKSPSVQEGTVSDLLSCILAPASPVWRDRCSCCHCSTSRPPPLLPLCQHRAATEALARFQGGSDPAATSITSSPLGNYQACEQTTIAFELFQGWEAQASKTRRSCFLECFFCACLLVLASCVHFTCKRSIFSSQACCALKHTKQRCQRAQEEPRGGLLCLCFLSPLTSLIPAPGVIRWTVRNTHRHAVWKEKFWKHFAVQYNY